jgi:hypothetical protein
LTGGWVGEEDENAGALLLPAATMLAVIAAIHPLPLYTTPRGKTSSQWNLARDAIAHSPSPFVSIIEFNLSSIAFNSSLLAGDLLLLQRTATSGGKRYTTLVPLRKWRLRLTYLYIAPTAFSFSYISRPNSAGSTIYGSHPH